MELAGPAEPATIDLNELRMHVYRQFAEHARAVDPEEVAAAFGVRPAAALDALRALDDAHLLVLDQARQRIVMAHPWTAGPMGLVVASESQKWWGGCAWDSFAIPALVGSPCLVATHCPACGRVLALDVRPDAPPDSNPGDRDPGDHTGTNTGGMVAHLPVPVARMWDDVVRTCSSQLLFCDREHLAGWLARTGAPEGAVLGLTALWDLATGWYAGRLSRGYRRRNPAEAAAFFAGIGLAGKFWAP
jgi:Alkylmercury lyase